MDIIQPVVYPITRIALKNIAENVPGFWEDINEVVDRTVVDAVPVRISGIFGLNQVRKRILGTVLVGTNLRFSSQNRVGIRDHIFYLWIKIRVGIHVGSWIGVVVVSVSEERVNNSF